MPVIDYIKDEHTQIVTWEVSESFEELSDLVILSASRQKRLDGMPAKQQLEYLGLRACLSILNSDLDVLYNEKGKPYLDNDKHLSITHSYGLVSVALSSFEIGVDIEMKRDEKIQNIAPKFVRDDESEWIEQSEFYTDFLHIIWGIKEGLYKLNGGNLYNFLHHYRVESFELMENKTILCWISDGNSSRKYFAYYKMIGSYYLTWVLDYKNNLELSLH